jgi:hypothetical protein
MFDKGFAESCIQQRPLEKFLDDKGVFTEGSLSVSRQRKTAIMVSTSLAIFFAKSQPSAKKCFFKFFTEGFLGVDES